MEEHNAARARRLEPVRLEVAFRSKGQKDLKHLQIGEKTPTGTDLYARFPDQKRVFLVSSFLDTTFNKNTFALRDRRILIFDRNKVDGLELTSGTTKTRLTKSGSDWRLASPISVRADFAAVEGALERLSSTQMQGIVDPDGKDLAKYGLTKPTGTITVNTGSSSAALTLGSTENALLFAKDASRPLVFTIAPVLKDDVIRTVAEFRRKDLFDGRAFTATKAEFKRGAETITLEKSTGKDNMDVWKAGGKDVDSAKADDLLSKVTALRAASFEDQANASLKSPALVVTVTFAENKQETVTFGRMGTEVFASRSDEPGNRSGQRNELNTDRSRYQRTELNTDRSRDQRTELNTDRSRSTPGRSYERSSSDFRSSPDRTQRSSGLPQRSPERRSSMNQVPQRQPGTTVNPGSRQQRSTGSHSLERTSGRSSTPASGGRGQRSGGGNGRSHQRGRD